MMRFLADLHRADILARELAEGRIMVARHQNDLRAIFGKALQPVQQQPVVGQGP